MNRTDELLLEAADAKVVRCGGCGAWTHVEQPCGTCGRQERQ